jgi:hypothetical protein
MIVGLFCQMFVLFDAELMHEDPRMYEGPRIISLQFPQSLFCGFSNLGERVMFKIV